MKKIRLVLCLVMIAALLTGCMYFPATFGNSLGSQSGTSADKDYVTISAQEYEELKSFAIMQDMMDLMDAEYYQDIDREAMLEMATRGLLYALEDPYTFYYSPEEYAEMWADDEGNYAGVGIQILASYETLICTVSRVFDGTPAQEVGLHKGDILVRVEDLDVTAYTLNDAVNIMRGKVGEIVEVEVLRGEERIVFQIPRAVIQVNRVSSMMLGDDIGYIFLYEFAGDCWPMFQEAVKNLKAQGAKGIILDLRDNPGGWVDDALSIADMFLDEGVIYYTEFKSGERQYNYSKNGKEDLKLVILINEGSASASEILAGSLQDHGQAEIVGTQSYGKGVVQYVIPIGTEGAGMQFTAAQYFTPNDNPVHGVGITPDVEVQLEEGDNGMYELGDLTDPQLAKALEVMETSLGN